MRLALVIRALHGGGAERFAVNFANYWSRRGHDIAIITFSPLDVTALTLDPSVRIMLLDKKDSTSSLDALLSNIGHIVKIRKALAEFRPCVAIGIIEWAAILTALASVGMPWRTVGSERTFPPAMPIPRIWRVLRRYTYRLLDVVVAQTTVAAVWLEQNTFSKRVLIIPNSITVPIADNVPLKSPATVCPPDKKIVLACGRLGPEKRFDLLVRAYSSLLPAHPSWDLVILGEGVERERLERLVIELDLAGRVHLPGRAGNMSSWYERASIFALTSRFEGFPNVLLEAMAYGVACVSMDCDTGPRDMIESGSNGILVPPGDETKFAEALKLLADDEPLRLRLGKSALAVREKFSDKNVMDQWLSIFSELER